MAQKLSERPRPLIVVVGAGLGGLAAAIALLLTDRYAVLVLETTTLLKEIGAGIQLSPNCTRLLTRWGVTKYLESKVVVPTFSKVCRWEDGILLSEQHTPEESTQRRFGAPYWHVHRADFHAALLQRYAELGGGIRTGAHVVDAGVGTDTVRPWVKLEAGEVLECDFIVGADGLRSKIRERVVFGDADLQSTGDYAFRFTIPTQEIKEDIVLAELARVPGLKMWWGPDKHIVTYQISGGTLLNVVVLLPDDGGLKNESKALGDIEEMKAAFEGWCSQVQCLLSRASPTDLTKWKLMDLAPLPMWNNGSCALVGDACHPMLPYLAQGASQAVEDAAALAVCLGGLHEDPPKAAEMYTKLRHERATKVQSSARDQRLRNHLPDGPAQRARDAELLSATAALPWKWESTGSEPAKQWIDGLYTYDAEEHARAMLQTAVTI
ncbi:FAD/NAD(P)-binding domain-containing protein [Thozetella sp. PMI_491]|nr:FAD/NAD(P)-binding domain-containing protein [Thozetella sp. PMI_491]